MRYAGFWKPLIYACLCAIVATIYFLTQYALLEEYDDGSIIQLRVGIAAVVILTCLCLLWRNIRRFQLEQKEVNECESFVLQLRPRGKDEYKTSQFWHDTVGLVTRDGNHPSPHFTIDIISQNGSILFFLKARQPIDFFESLTAEIKKAWPKTEVELIKESDWAIRAAHWIELGIQSKDIYPINVPPLRDFSAPGRALHQDGVTDMLSALSSVKHGDVGIQIAVRSAPEGALQKWERQATRMRRKLQTKHTHIQEYRHTSKRRSFGPLNEDTLKRDLQTLVDRLEDILIETNIRIWGDHINASHIEQVARQIVSATAGGRNQLKLRPIKSRNTDMIKDGGFSMWGGLIMTASEMDRMVHMPGQATCNQYPMVVTAGAEKIPATEPVVVPHAQTLCTPFGLQLDRYRQTVAQSTNYRVFGMGNDARSNPVMIGQRFDATREHTFIFGPTGTGKSTLAENMLLQDWLGGDNHSVLVIDPHGELIQNILECVPRDRESDVIIIDPHDIQPPRINTLNINQAQEAVDKDVGAMLEAFKYAIGASWETSVGMKDVLLQAMTMVKCLDGDASMCDLESFLGVVSDGMEDARNAKFSEIKKVDLPIAGIRALAYWNKEFMALNKQARNQSIGAAKRRVKAFLNSDEIRATMGMSGSTINLEEAINSGKLILVVMGDQMGEVDRKIWGALLVREFISILKRRERSKRQLAALYIDEFASTIGTMKAFVKEICAEVRKFGGAATLITQTYAQIPSDTIDELKANCRTQIAFSASPEDAAIAESLFQQKVKAEDVQALPPYHIYLLPSIKGAQAPPCLVKTFPPATRPRSLPSNHWPFHNRWSFVLGKVDHPSEQPLITITLRNIEDATDLFGRERVMKIIYELIDQHGPDLIQQVYKAKTEYDAWRHTILLRRPGIIPDRSTRIRTLSRLAYGIPFWWSLIEYKDTFLETTTRTRKNGHIKRSTGF